MHGHEVDWWRAHREHQPGADDGRELVDCLTRLYAYLYGCDPDHVRPAAILRAEAMDTSDRWVADGCSVDSQLIADAGALLVRSYASLLAAVHRPCGRLGG